MYYVSISNKVVKVTDCADCILPDSVTIIETDNYAEGLWRAKHLSESARIAVDFTDISEQVKKSCGVYHCFHVCRKNTPSGERFWECDHSQSSWDDIRFLDNDDIKTISLCTH